MTKSTLHRWLVLTGWILGIWLLVRYALPLLFPFLLGGALALAAEPMVRLLHRKLKLKQWLASSIGVTAMFILMLALLALLLALLVRQAGRLTDLAPELVESARIGMGSLESWLLTTASAAPEGIRSVINRTVTGLFSDGSAMVEKLASTLPGVLSRVLGHVTNGALTLATAVLAAFMISGKLPLLRSYTAQKLPQSWRQQYLPALQGLKHTVLGWLTAQLKLTLVIMGLLLASFLLLKLPHSVMWAVVISVVDALPVLGCGVVLVPWSLICLLQGERLRCIGLLGTYALVWLVRSVLEPRLLGKELGLDPLVTLLAIYLGYRLLGLPGMLLAPIAAVIVARVSREFPKRQDPKSP